MNMLEKMLDLKNTFEGKFLAVFMSVVLVMSMTNILAFAGDEDEKDASGTGAAPSEQVVDDSDTKVVEEVVQHGEDAAAGDADANTVPTEPLVTTTVDEAVVTFVTSNAYVSVKGQVLSGTTLNTELHKELQFAASADTGFELGTVTAKNAANADVPVVTQDGVSTIAAEYVDSTLVVEVTAEAVQVDEPIVSETTPITSDTKIEAGDDSETPKVEADDDAETPKVEETTEQFSVTLKVEGAEDEVVKVDAGKSITLEEPADLPKGASFLAWMDEQSQSYAAGDELVVFKDIVLTAELGQAFAANSISMFSMMAAPQQDLNVMIHYVDGSREDTAGVIATGSVSASDIDGYDFVNATVGLAGDVVTYTAMMDGKIYYGTEQSLSAGIAKPLPDGETIFLNYEKTPVKHTVTVSVEGPDSLYADGNEVVPGAGTVEVAEGSPFNFQVKTMVGYTATVSYVGADGKTVKETVKVGNSQEFIEKVFTTGSVNADSVVTVSYTKAENLTFKFDNPGNAWWHGGAISYTASADSNLTTNGNNNLLWNSATFTSGSTVSFDIQTSRTSANLVNNWGYWQLNGLAINGQGLNIPENKDASDVGNSAVTLLNNGSRVTITVTDAQIEKYSYKNHDCVLFTYRVTIENARSNISMTSGNFHNVYWPEILLRKADGVSSVKIGGSWATVGIPVTQNGKTNMTFEVKPGYENPVATIDEQRGSAYLAGWEQIPVHSRLQGFVICAASS